MSNEEGYHNFGSGIYKDSGCVLHDACLSCLEKICIDDDNRLSHKEYHWFLHFVDLMKTAPGASDPYFTSGALIGQERSVSLLAEENERRDD